MDKNKFIKNILDYSLKKEVDSKTKDRLISLVSKEVDKSDITKEILKRIEKLETSTNEKTKENVKSNTNSKTKYINPSNLYKFLLAYNQDPILKYTCHEIDDEEIIDEINRVCETSDYNFTKHQVVIEQRFDELSKSCFVNPNIKNLILVYLKGKSYSGKYDRWSSEKIAINWKSRDLIEWCKTNPGFVPNPGVNLINKMKNKGFRFKKGINSNLTGQRISSFSGLVIHFKHLFHIRGDNSLKKIINNINQIENWNDKINFEITEVDFWDNLELFTDVDKFILAYKTIIGLIIEIVDKTSKEKPFVKLSFKEEKSNIIFSIHHKNSVYQKTINDTLSKREGETYTRLIEKQINGVCDLYLKADFGNNKYAEINIWNGKDKNLTKLENVKGVEHILKFTK